MNGIMAREVRVEGCTCFVGTQVEQLTAHLSPLISIPSQGGGVAACRRELGAGLRLFMLSCI